MTGMLSMTLASIAASMSIVSDRSNGVGRLEEGQNMEHVDHSMPYLHVPSPRPSAILYLWTPLHEMQRLEGCLSILTVSVDWQNDVHST
jgi:hypothetical protein